MRTITAVLTLLVASTVAIADCGPAQDICAADSPWARSHNASLRIQQGQSSNFAQWDFTFAGDNDMLIAIDTRQGSQQTQGKIMLVSGRAMLTKGLELESGYEIDALDTPVLMYQLAVSLLAQALPDGPKKLTGSRKIDLREPNRAIGIATQSASGRFQSPWSLKGSAERKDLSTVAFSFTFTYAGEKSSDSMVLSGQWAKKAVSPTFDDSMNIEGWALHVIGPFTVKQERGTIYDYGAQSKPLAVRTLGGLRKALQKDEASSNK